MVRAGGASATGQMRASRLSHDRLHARLPRADDVGQRIVADVQDLVRGHARHVASAAKMRASGLAAPAAIAVTWPSKKSPIPQRSQIGVAVAHREQPITRAQPRERGTHVVVEFDPVACGEEHLERLLAAATRRSRRAVNCSASARRRKNVRSWLCSGNCAAIARAGRACCRCCGRAWCADSAPAASRAEPPPQPR